MRPSGFTSLSSRHHGASHSPGINVVPLVDVLLVLLVILIVTAPVLTHLVKTDLPKASSGNELQSHERVELTIDEQGIIYWNGEVLHADALEDRLREAARQEPKPDLLVLAHRLTPYERVAQILAKASRAGLVRVGFALDPR